MTSQLSVARGLEAASIAYTMLMAGDDFGATVCLVWGDMIAEIEFPAIDQRECAKAPCPALTRAVGTTAGAMSGTTGVIATELLAALMTALRRLAELEGVPVARVVASLIAETTKE